MWICDKCDQVKIEYLNDNMGIKNWWEKIDA